mmetsp:Transcript_41092/g.128858  ORF Transcript_41092/g.128858 Transcript_41092/m.128858 type:complete len:108 (-) Transcript_41092:1636-1959(-)
MDKLRHVPEEGEAAAAALYELLGKIVRVHIDDGRAVTGVFKCIDEHRNFIIGETQEARPVTEEDVGGATRTVQDERSLGSVMVPGEHVVRIEVTDLSLVELVQAGAA